MCVGYNGVIPKAATIPKTDKYDQLQHFLYCIFQFLITHGDFPPTCKTSHLQLNIDDDKILLVLKVL